MTGVVDLSQLAIDREHPDGSPLRPRRSLLTRYVLPGLLLMGFAALIGWTSRDLIFHPREVTVVPVLATQDAGQQEGTPLFQAAGWVEPRPTPVRVAALAPGVVEQLLVVEDQPVKAGEPVAVLVKEDAQLAYEGMLAEIKLRQAERDEAQAAKNAAETRLEQPVHLDAALGDAEASLAKIETELKNLPFEVRRAEARLEFARQDHDSKVSAKGAVAERIVLQARSELDAAQATVEELGLRNGSLRNEKAALIQRRDALKRQRTLLADEIRAQGETEARLQATIARLEQTQVAVAQAKLRLDRMTVRAPIDGRVYQLVGQPGTTLTGGMGVSSEYDGSTVVTLYRPEMLQVRVDVRFDDIPKVGLGQPVQIRSPAVEKPLSGKVLFISSLANIQKNTLQVKVEIEQPPGVFKPEMLVDATFLAGHAERKSAPTDSLRFYVPQNLVHTDADGTFVWLADQSAEVAVRKPVKAGAANGEGLVEITSGLDVSSRVIAGGSDGLRHGDAIRVTSEAPGSGMSHPVPHATGNQPLSRLPERRNP